MILIGVKSRERSFGGRRTYDHGALEIDKGANIIRCGRGKKRHANVECEKEYETRK